MASDKAPKRHGMIVEVPLFTEPPSDYSAFYESGRRWAEERERAFLRSLGIPADMIEGEPDGK